MAQQEGYPVVWRGITYRAGPKLTASIKEEFCEWVRQTLIDEAIASLGNRPWLLQPQIAHINANKPWWGDGVMHDNVRDALASPKGDRKFNRLLFGDSVKVLADTEFNQLLTDKETEQTQANLKAIQAGMTEPFPPVNDYFVAMQRIRETADPKANGAAASADQTVAPDSAAS